MEKYSRDGHRKRIRQVYIENGGESTSDANLLELYLTTLIPRRDVKLISYELMNRFKTIEGVFEADVEELARVQGIGEKTAYAMKMLFSVVQKKNQVQDNDDSRRDRLVGYIRDSEDYSKNHITIYFLDNDLGVIGKIGFDCFDYESKKEIISQMVRLKSSMYAIARVSTDGSTSINIKDKELIADLKQVTNLLSVYIYDYYVISKEKTEYISKVDPRVLSL